jgi:pyridoxal phosphate enzyme (YggS family)
MVEVRLSDIRERVASAAMRVGRSEGDVTILAVGKAHPVEMILRAYELGQREFGENRAQELDAKVAQLPPDIRWHFVGPLQRNKVRLVRPAVVLLHSMDRLSLGRAWVKGPGKPPPVLLEVNIGREPQKAGVLPEEAGTLLDGLEDIGVEVRGLMVIPPLAADPESTRPYFRQTAALRRELAADHPALTELSMGMSDDFEVAIEEGATIIRLGRAIFGPRPT